MLASFVMECVGTLFLVFTAASTNNAIAVALTYGVMVYMGSHISGGQYNPALTLGLWSMGKIKPSKALVHIVGQVVGGLLALGFFYLLGGKEFLIAPATGASFFQSGIAEVLFSFVLALSVFLTMVDKRSAGNSYYGLVIGATLLLGSFTVGSISGGVFNPILGLMPQVYRLLVKNVFQVDVALLYLVAPIIGAFLASQLFELLTSHKEN